MFKSNEDHKKLALAKVCPPIRHMSLVWRHNAVSQLTKLKTSAQIALLVAPSGYGKTSLVCTWSSRQNSMLSAWYSLDAQDDRIGRFMDYLLLAFAQNPQLQPLTVGKPECRSVEEAVEVCDELLYDIALLNQDVLLIIDNYQHLREGMPSQTLVAYLIEHAPQNLRFVIASRQMPRAGFAKHHLTDKIVIIDESQLTFTVEECGDYLRKRGLESQDLSASRLWDLTLGWPAFVALAVTCVAMGIDDEQAFESSAALNDMFERYVIEELVGELDTDVYDFALIASQIQPFCASLMEEVLEVSRTDVNRMLSKLIDRRLLTSPSRKNDTESWFEFHPRVASALLRSFHAKSSKSSLEVYQKAGDWLARNGKVNQSVLYAKRNKDWQFIVAQIEDHWEAMGQEDSVYMLYRWGKMIPKDVLVQAPKACSVLSFSAILYGDSELSQFCERVSQSYYVDEGLPFYLEATVFHLQVCNVQGRYAEARQALDKVTPHVDKLSFYQNHLVRQHEIALAENPDWLRFRNMVLELLPETFINTSEMYIVNNYSLLCLCESFLGNFANASEYASKESSAPRKAKHPGRAARVNYHFSRMVTSYYRGDLKEALLQREKFETFTHQHSLQFFNAISSSYAAILAYQKSTLKDVAGLLLASSNLTPYGLLMSPLPYSMILELEEAALFDFAGFVRSSYRENDQSFAWNRLRFVYALLKGDTDHFDELKQSVLAIESARRLDLINAYLLLALYHDARSEPDKADQAFIQAMDHAMPEAIIQPFLNDHAYYLPILDRLHRSSEMDDFAAKLFTRMSRLAKDGASALAIKTDVLLTAREREVLYQLVSGHRTHEIAQRLGISKATTSRHIANIYEKYGVHSRTQLLLNVM